MLRISVRYYSALRRAIGREAEAVYVDDGARVGDLIAQVIARFPQVQPYESTILVAKNSEYVSAGETLKDGDTIDIMPPVSGG